MSWRDNYLDEESPVFLEFLDKNPEAGWDEAGEFAHQFMLDRWVGKKQFDGLTSVFCEEFDTKKGERWYVKLSDVLVKHGETENVEKLWKTFFSRIERSFKWRVIMTKRGTQRSAGSRLQKSWIRKGKNSCAC